MRKYQKILILFLLLIYLGNCFCGCESITGANGIFKSPAPVTIFDDSVKNVGIYMKEPAEIERLKVKPNILGWFEPWGTPFAINKAQLCVQKQMTPLITWQPKGYTLTDIANGVHDELIRDYLSNINEIFGENTVLIRLAHEMELYSSEDQGWYHWQYFGGEQDYINMWRHVVSIGQEVAPNVRWIWSPNRINETAAGWYPGDEYVDYVSITLNHDANRSPSYTRFEDYYLGEGRAECFEMFDKKVLLSEVAYSGSDEKVKGEYMKSIFDYAEKDDRVCGVVFLDSNVSDDRMYRFSDNDYLMDIWYDGVTRLQNNAEEQSTGGQSTEK